MKPRSKTSNTNINCCWAVVILGEGDDAFDRGISLEDGDSILNGGDDGERLG